MIYKSRRESFKVTSIAVECACGASVLVLFWLLYRYSLFIPSSKGLPILLYHKVSLAHNDKLTIPIERVLCSIASYCST